MLNKVCVYTPFYQEIGKHLEHHLEAEKESGVKLGIYIDGPFPLFEHDNKMKSDDGCRELILSYDHTKILDTGSNFMPIKNNLALHEAGKQGYKQLLVTGCDEWIEGQINELVIPDDSLICRIPVVDHNPTGKYNRWETSNPRLICDVGLIRCVDVHWFWFFNNELISFEEGKLLEGITIHSDDNMRPDKRDKKMTEYQDRNVPRERALLRYKYMERILSRDYPPVVSLSGNLYYSCGCINRPDGVRLKKCERHEKINPKL
jgi:hypothetical protein